MDSFSFFYDIFILMLHNNNGDIMNKDNYNDGLFKFVEKATCSFTCVSEIKDLLTFNGYIELCELIDKYHMTGRAYRQPLGYSLDNAKEYCF